MANSPISFLSFPWVPNISPLVQLKPPKNLQGGLFAEGPSEQRVCFGANEQRLQERRECAYPSNSSSLTHVQKDTYTVFITVLFVLLLAS